MISEGRLQQDIYMWFHNQFPHYRGLLCYNLNNSKNRIDGSRNRSLGLQAGRSDLTLYYQKRAYMIELKTTTGIQSKQQKEWQRIIESHGFEYVIIRSLDEFKYFVFNIVLK